MQHINKIVWSYNKNNYFARFEAEITATAAVMVILISQSLKPYKTSKFQS